MAGAGSWWQRYGLIVKALGIALFFVGLKAVASLLGLEMITTLPLLTGLMGAVVFTLAILLAGVLADFKESERLVTELASELERLDADLPLAFRDESALARARGHVRSLVQVVHHDLTLGQGIRMREVQRPVAALDADLARLAVAGGPPNYIIYARQHIAAVLRMVHRLEGIIETTFVATAYAIAGLVVGAALVALLLTNVQPLGQALVLYGFSAFLLIGLFLLIKDLDNPFDGHARVDLRPLAKLAALPPPGPEPGRTVDEGAGAPAAAP